MKKFFAFCTLAAAVLGGAMISGCDDKPTIEQVTVIGMSTGVAAGQVTLMTVKDKEAITNIAYVVHAIDAIVPDVGQSYEDVWTNAAELVIAELIDAGKIDQKQGEMIALGVKLLAKAADYMIAKYPKIAEDKALVDAGIKSVCTGYLAVVDPTTMSAANVAGDKEVYDYLSEYVK